QAIPVSNPAAPKDGMIDVLIFFEDPSAAVAKGDILTVKSHFLLENAMVGLEKVGTDYVAVVNPHSIPVQAVEIVLVYPAPFGTISGVAEGEGNWAPMGMTNLKAQYLSNLHNYNAVGASAKNLAPNSSFKVNFFKNKR